MGTGAGRGSGAHRADRATDPPPHAAWIHRCPRRWRLASAKASGVTNLLPASAQNWLEYLAEVQRGICLFRQRDWTTLSRVRCLDQAIIGHAIQTESGDIDVPTLTTAQRSTAVECLRTTGTCCHATSGDLRCGQRIYSLDTP
jgi:hypothetical protein